MRERRWESRATFKFSEVMSVCLGLRNLGIPVKTGHEEFACYLEEFWVDHLEEIDRLGSWPIDEVTLVEIDDEWAGDFFLLAANHHELYRQRAQGEEYLSIAHAWQVPNPLKIRLHQREAMFWIGFRALHAFVRLRVGPLEVITPGERRGDGHRYDWIAERAAMLCSAIEVLGLPIKVEWGEDVLSVSGGEPAGAVASSWPDAFGPCQIEYTFPDRYELLVPSARFVSELGKRPSTLKTFLSGCPRGVIKEFHELQPTSKLMYRGYIHARLADLSAIIEASGPTGRVIASVSEFQTGRFLGGREDAYAVVAVIGNLSGFKVEIRLNRAPLPEEGMAEWLESLLGIPLVYAPLAMV